MRRVLLGLRATASASPACFAPCRNARRRRPRLEQLPARDRPRRRRPDLPPRHVARERCASARASIATGASRAATRRAALACLARFRERLRGLHPSAVRAVATNTFRVARNAARVPAAGRSARSAFPIDVIGGHEEARLIYLGVAHVLPASPTPRLVIDIGGGSTEFIIGRGLEPRAPRIARRSAASACRSASSPTASCAPTRSPPPRPQARAEIEAIASEFAPEHWRDAYASSGTALALAEILEQNGLSTGGITPTGLARLRKRMIAAGPRRPAARSTALKPRARAGARRAASRS